jgi:hypothetical protein
MAIEKRLSIALSDISEVVFVCKKCGTRLGLPPNDWNTTEVRCLNCLKTNYQPPDTRSPQYELIELFKRALLGAMMTDSSFEVRLEFSESPEGI